MVLVINNYNNVNVVSDSDGNSSDHHIKNNNKNSFDDDIDDKVKTTPQTTINAKVV